MKRNILVAVGIALVFASSLVNARAQNDAPAPAPAATPQNLPTRFSADNPAPTPNPALTGTNQPLIQRMPSARFHQGHPMFARAITDLRAVKMELQRTEGDLGGHKNSAIAACDKAMLELTEALKALPSPPPPAQRPTPLPPGATPLPAAPANAPAPAAPPAQPQP